MQERYQITPTHLNSGNFNGAIVGVDNGDLDKQRSLCVGVQCTFLCTWKNSMSGLLDIFDLFICESDRSARLRFAYEKGKLSI